jgi:NTE family protein
MNHILNHTLFSTTYRIISITCMTSVMTWLAGCATTTSPPKTLPNTPVTVTEKSEGRIETPTKLKIGLALGGGAARGFAHIGVIKALEAQGIVPDIIVGTSAGSVVGALYANGYSPTELQKLAINLDEKQFGDFTVPNRGILKGEALQNYINKLVQNKPIEQLSKPFAAVAADLKTGEMVIFQRGNTGMAVRASSTVPGVFQPMTINGKDYVDGGLVSPVPVRAARQLGADRVIAVDISAKPQYGTTDGSIDILLHTYTVMGQAISQNELREADVLLRPELGAIKSSDFSNRHIAILEGEKIVTQSIQEIRTKVGRLK